MSTIPRVAALAAEQFRDQIALEEPPGQGTPVKLTFHELWQGCVSAARGFIAAGVVPGDRVAIWAPNRHEWILAAVGLQIAGAALVPINTRYKPREAAYVLERSRAKLLVSVGSFLGTDYLGALGAELGHAAPGEPGVLSGLPALEAVICLPPTPTPGPARVETPSPSWALPFAEFIAAGQRIEQAEALSRAMSVAPGDTSDILFTSGTTGHPKGVVTTHGQNLRAFRAWTEVIGLTASDRYLIVNPFFHAFGYKAGWLSCLLRGATILPHPVFDVAEVLRRVATERISVLPGPPALYQSILASPELPQHDLSSLRLAVTGAASIPVELIQRMKGELGIETVITGYGLTETCGVVAMCRFDDDAETIATTSGRAIEGVEMQAVDASGSPVPPGEPGEIVVRGFNVMQGYFEDAEATGQAIDKGGWLHTGDIGVIDARGYVRITDRIKDMYICGGFNCYPAEIERLLLTHPEVVQAAVIGVPDPRLGEVGMAFVVPRAGSKLSGPELSTWCKPQLANFKLPRYVELVDALPMNATGKVTKFVLRERALALLSGPEPVGAG